MANSLESPGRRIRALWARLSPWPGGRWAFARLLGLMVPYTGSIRPLVLELRPGFARVQLRERRALQNHLHSVHAVALGNLAEVTSGLAMLTALPEGVRGIVTGLSIGYEKKARGRITAEAACALPEIHGEVELEFGAVLSDGAGDVVARATARWRLEPVPR
jgi:acyl-coenzyme A thioesterase PaaI-like protein